MHVNVFHPIVVNVVHGECDKELSVSEDWNGREVLSEIFPQTYEPYALCGCERSSY